MDLKKIENFIVIAEEKNITKAAKRLYVSQPALSQQLTRLEKELGVVLFNRVKNTLSLTYAGEVYLKASREIINTKKHAYNLLADVSTLKNGKITIGVSPFRGAVLIPAIYPVFHEKYPGIQIELVEDIGNTLEAQTEKGYIDFSIIAGDAFESNLNYDRLCTEEIILAVPKSYSVSQDLTSERSVGKRLMVDLIRFKDVPFMMMKEGSKIRKISDDIFERAGFCPNILMETKNITTIQNMICSGVACTLIPEKIIDYFSTRDCLDFYSISPGTDYWDIVVAYRKDYYLNEAMVFFIDLLRKYLNNMV